MMQKKRFQFRHWATLVYCNSLGNALFEFYITDNGQRKTVEVTNHGIDIWGKRPNVPTSLVLPKYLIQQAYDEFLKIETFTLYEVDRDGNKRYGDNMRYSSIENLPDFREMVIYALKKGGAK